jgi:hypothetical protein
MLARLIESNSLDRRVGVSAEAMADYLCASLHHFAYALDCARPAQGLALRSLLPEKQEPNP